MKILASNKKAILNYEILEEFECGISLFGWEVKSSRHGMVNLKDGFVNIQSNEVILHNVTISRWKTQSISEHIDTERPRKLLLKRAEIDKLDKRLKIKGNTLVPIKMYLARNKIKLEIALVRGKKQFEKRAVLKEKDQTRQIQRDLKSMGY